MHPHGPLIAAGAAILLAGTNVLGGITCPNEFDSPDNALGPLFAYFGGVVDWGTAPSTTTIQEGDSLEVWADLVEDIFTVTGFAVGTFGISPPDLDVAPAADTFSITVQSPTNGTLSISVTLREDDNGDGVIDAGNDDDQWESPTVLFEPGVNVYNIPLSSFVDTDPDVGNNVQNFATTGQLAYYLVFETRESYPGGRITEPVSFLIDHVGLYEGSQSLPGQPADFNNDGVVDTIDFLELLSTWGPCDGCDEDLNGDGVVDTTDLLELLAGWS